MVNSVPINQDYLREKGIVKIESYEGKQFVTQQGYAPMMTKSRYAADPP